MTANGYFQLVRYMAVLVVPAKAPGTYVVVIQRRESPDRSTAASH